MFDLLGQAVPIPAAEGTGNVTLTFSVQQLVVWTAGLLTGFVTVLGIVVRWCLNWTTGREDKYERKLDEVIDKFIARQHESDERIERAEARNLDIHQKSTIVLEKVTVSIDQHTQAIRNFNDRIATLEGAMKQLPPPGRRQGSSGGA